MSSLSRLFIEQHQKLQISGTTPQQQLEIWNVMKSSIKLFIHERGPDTITESEASEIEGSLHRLISLFLRLAVKSKSICASVHSSYKKLSKMNSALHTFDECGVYSYGIHLLVI